MKSRFKEQVADNAHKQKSQGSSYGHLALPRNVNVFKEEPDTRVMLDFIPYRITDPKHPDRDDDRGTAMVGELWYKRPYKLHRNVGANNDSYVCPTSIGKKCPICEHRSKRAKEDAERDELKELKPSLRNLYIVVPKGHKEFEAKPHIWDISQYLFQEMLNDEIGEDPERAVFPDLEEGLTLKIRFGENQIGKNKFAETSRIDFEQREEAYSEKILTKIPNLDECLIVPGYEQLHAKFFELEEAEESDTKPAEKADDDDEPWTKPKAKPVEDDEDPAPVRKPKRIVGDDDEDDEKPKEKTTPKRPNTIAYDDDASEEKPTRQSATKADKAEPAAKKDKCPHGHTFAIDCEKFDECDDCKVWEACYEAKGKLHKGKK